MNDILTATLDSAPGGEQAIQRLQRMGIRESEVLRYFGEALAARVEMDYARGFNAALRLAAMGKREEEVEDLLQQGCSSLYQQHFFVRGYKRGLAEWKERREDHVPLR